MKIESLRIENLRSFADETIRFNDYTCLVGPNGAGKSTVLCALNVFFRCTDGSSIDVSCLDRDDFHHKDTTRPVTITVTFTDLCPEAQEELKAYYRGGKLIVTAEAVWKEDAGAPVVQYGQRLAMAEFAPFFEAEDRNEPASELKKIYQALQTPHPGLPKATSKADMALALQEYEAARPESCEPIRSTDQFYGFSKGANRLAKYIQWVYIPAMKDAATEQTDSKSSALSALLDRTVRSKVDFGEPLASIRAKAKDDYDELLRGQQDQLDDLSGALTRRVAEWAHPGASLKLEWFRDPERSVRVEAPSARVRGGEGSFESDFARFGHGFQRSILLALLQELASSDTEGGPRLLLGIEEPELYQHPPQARHLASVLHKLSGADAQILACTHSPFFVAEAGFEDVRVVVKSPTTGKASVRCTTAESVEDKVLAAAERPAGAKPRAMAARIRQTLQPVMSEMFFTPVLVLVEGIEDAAYLHATLQLSDKWGDFRQSGCHIVPVNGKEYLLRPLAIATELGIRVIAVFDSDSAKYAAAPAEGETEGQLRRREQEAIKHRTDNLAVQRLLGVASPVAFVDDDRWEQNMVMWKSDMGGRFREDLGAEVHDRIKGEVQRDYQAAHLAKNPMHIADVVERAWEQGLSSPSMLRLCDHILNFARGAGVPENATTEAGPSAQARVM